MTRTLLAGLSFGVGVALAPVALAHDEPHAHGTPTAVGNVHLPVSCTPAAQEQFDRAMALQHFFWYQAATEGFRQARQTDASCVMTY